jgi:benzoyl-CoA 2,3-dioxygenase component B
VQRCAELTNTAPHGDVRAAGGVPLDMIQKHINFWVSSSTDLFGGEISSNAADFFASGLKGRFHEDKETEHRALEGTYRMAVPEGGKLVDKDIPLRNAMNEVLRDNYIDDCQRAVDKWNRTLVKAGLSPTLRLPSRRFNREQGIYAAGLRFDIDGNALDEETWQARKYEWLPSPADRDYVRSLMQPVTEPGKIANWVAPPARGINGQAFEFEYVKHPA